MRSDSEIAGVGSPTKPASSRAISTTSAASWACIGRIVARSTCVIFDVGNRRSPDFAVSDFPIGDAAAQKFEPRRHRNGRIDLFRQRPPELGVVPAPIVTRAVAMGADAGTQALHLPDQLVAGEPVEICIQERLHRCALTRKNGAAPNMRPPRRYSRVPASHFGAGSGRTAQ